MELQFTPRRRSTSAGGRSMTSEGSVPFVKELKFNKATAQTPGRYLASKRTTEPLKVFLRVRPSFDEKEDEFIRIESDTNIVLNTPETSDSYKKGDRESNFQFTKIFDQSASQKEIYETTCSPLVDHLFERRNGLLFAYGITNSGKTFTIQGTDEQPGIIRNVLSDIFSRIDQNSKYSVWLSFLEIYNEKIYDLLQEREASKKQIESLRLIANKQNQVYVRGLMEIEVSSMEEALQVISKGERHRKVGETLINSDSSRSHAVCTIKLLEKQSDNSFIWSKMCLVDLAGAERTRRTATNALHHQGDRFKETVKINTSLMKLGRCLEILRWNQQHPDHKPKVVPFREAKITRLFKDYLLGWGYTIMIATASPSTDDYDETYHSLRYAAIAREIVCSSRIDTGRVIKAPLLAAIASDDGEESDGEIDNLLDEIYSLKKQLMAERERAMDQEARLRKELVSSSSEQIEAMEEEFAESLNDQRRRLENKFNRQLELWKSEFLGRMTGDGSDKESILRKDNESLERRCTVLKNELSELENQKLQAENMSKRQSSENDRLRREIELLEQSMKNSIEKSIALDKISLEKNELGHLVSQLKKDIAESSHECEELYLLVDEKSKEVESLIEEKEALEIQLKESSALSDKMHSSASELFESQIELIRDKVRERDEKITELQGKLDLMTRDTETHEQTVTELQKELREIKKSSKQSEKELKKTQKALENAESALDEAKERETLLQQENDQLIQLLETQTSETAAKENESIQSLNEQITQLLKENKNASNQLKKEQNESRTRIQRMEDEFNVKEANRLEEIETLKKTIQLKEEEYSELENRLTAFERNLQIVEQEYKEQAEQLDQLSSERKAKDALIESLEAQMETMQITDGFEDHFEALNEESIEEPPNAYGTLRTSKKVMDVLNQPPSPLSSSISESPVALRTKRGGSNTWDKIMNSEVSSDWLSALKRTGGSARTSMGSNSVIAEDTVESDTESNEAEDSFTPIARRLRRRR